MPKIVLIKEVRLGSRTFPAGTVANGSWLRLRLHRVMRFENDPALTVSLHSEEYRLKARLLRWIGNG